MYVAILLHVRHVITSGKYHNSQLSFNVACLSLVWTSIFPLTWKLLLIFTNKDIPRATEPTELLGSLFTTDIKLVAPTLHIIAKNWICVQKGTHWFCDTSWENLSFLLIILLSEYDIDGFLFEVWYYALWTSNYCICIYEVFVCGCYFPTFPACCFIKNVGYIIKAL